MTEFATLFLDSTPVAYGKSVFILTGNTRLRDTDPYGTDEKYDSRWIVGAFTSMESADKEMEEIMNELGKYSTGKSCLYIKKLEDVNIDLLKKLILLSYNYMTEKYG